MLQGQSLRRSDIVSGAILAALGGLILFEASSLPMGGTYGGVANPWYASPAAFPLFLGGLLIAGGIAVTVCGIRAAGVRGLIPFLKRVALAPLSRQGARNGGLVLALLGLYYLLLQLRLFGSANYVVSSALFLASFAILFFRPNGGRPRSRIAIAIAVAALLISVGVAALFSGPLRVPLP